MSPEMRDFLKAHEGLWAAEDRLIRRIELVASRMLVPVVEDVKCADCEGRVDFRLFPVDRE